MMDFLTRQGFSPEQARRNISMANKKKTGNVTAAIEYAASVKKDASIKQHLARFGLKNVIKDCGDWSRFPGMMKILAQLDAAGAADDATLRMLFGSEHHVAGMLEELRDMRGAAAGSPAAAMSRRPAPCCAMQRVRIKPQRLGCRLQEVWWLPRTRAVLQRWRLLCKGLGKA